MVKRCMGCMEEMGSEAAFCSQCGYAEGTPAAEACHLKPGTLLKERYLIGRVLGFGGFGVTYIGYDQLLEKKLAVKEYFPGEFSTRAPMQTEMTVFSGVKEEQFLSGKEKFIDEARRLAKLQNVPEIVQVYDCFEENHTAYIVMEYLEGETLKKKLEREGKMTVEQAVPIILTVLRALKAVHAIGILHRDIAPDNIFITSQGEVKLLDFGAARFATTTRTRSITTLFKPGFSPEEQYRSHGDQGPWTDVYALAATFYNMITGIVPEEALERAVQDHLKPPSKLGVTIGPNTEAALLNALNVKAEDRTQSAEEFESQLFANVVKRVVVKQKKADVGQWPVWVKALLGVGTTAVAVFVILMATGVIRFEEAQWGASDLPQGKTRVPNFVNEEMETALARGSEANLTVQVYDKQYSSQIPENRVLSQTVKSGTLLEEMEQVGIVISAGIEKTYVPNVIGVEEEEAVTMLKDAGLVVSSKEEEYRAAPGTIGWQSVQEGTETDTGTEIQIIVSKGISGGDPSVEERVDDLTGQAYEQAVDQMTEKYLYLVRRSSEYSDAVPEGAIIRQTPQAGSSLSQNSNIEVVVSLGKERVYVPDVQYKTQEEAVQLLADSGLTAEIQSEADPTVARGSIIRQETEAGSQVEKGSAVVIYVSTGAPPERNQQRTAPQQTAAAPPAVIQAPPQTEAAPPPATQAPPPTTQAPPVTRPANNMDEWLDPLRD